MIKKIAILTSGGDAPGMNSAIRAIVKAAVAENIEPYLVFEGFYGLYKNLIYPAKNYEIDYFNRYGGTFILSSRFEEFKNIEIQKKAVKNIQKHKIDALVIIGGDGSYQGAQQLLKHGVKVICIPGTIDNDIYSADVSIGYDTALNTIVSCIDSIRDSANAQKRIMIVEIMGNRCGDLTLYAGLATGAEVISTIEAPLSEEEIAQACCEIIKRKNSKRRSIIVLVNERIYDLQHLQKTVEKAVGRWTVRTNVLGHIQRGGNASAMERVNANMYGFAAVSLLKENIYDVALGMRNNKIVHYSIDNALLISEQKRETMRQRAKEYNKFNRIDV